MALAAGCALIGTYVRCLLFRHLDSFDVRSFGIADHLLKVERSLQREFSIFYFYFSQGRRVNGHGMHRDLPR